MCMEAETSHMSARGRLMRGGAKAATPSGQGNPAAASSGRCLSTKHHCRLCIAAQNRPKSSPDLSAPCASLSSSAISASARVARVTHAASSAEAADADAAMSCAERCSAAGVSCSCRPRRPSAPSTRSICSPSPSKSRAGKQLSLSSRRWSSPLRGSNSSEGALRSPESVGTKATVRRHCTKAASSRCMISSSRRMQDARARPNCGLRSVAPGRAWLR
mmetsp:Transcript_36253/g.91545  ORF Transcript_36253/g.91545 Transcript_36253/m.91545 type:complete len:218 (+) Transcript_36253:1338-1991(+)